VVAIRRGAGTAGPAEVAMGFAMRTRNPWISCECARCGNVVDGGGVAAGARRRFFGVTEERLRAKGRAPSTVRALGVERVAGRRRRRPYGSAHCRHREAPDASTAKQEGTGEYVDDTVITTKVKAAIFNEPTLKSAEINVETFKGVVQLSGFVSSPAAEKTAVAVAGQVGGVKSVKNDMRLK
jgi:osmotically-inducible protein OsmY